MLHLTELFIAEYPANYPLPDLATLCELNLFQIKTCQRTLLLAISPFSAPDARRTFSGVDAYLYLLRFSCGLESEIKGETDVFGQIKTVFKDLAFFQPDLSTSFQEIFSKLLEDTKEIRAQYLQGVGGNTYGTLAKRLLAPEAGNHILIVGAGQIAKSVAPYFSDFNLTVWNRSPERLTELDQSLQKKGTAPVTLATGLQNLFDAFQQADIIILATPLSEECREIEGMLNELAIANGGTQKILHLGGAAESISGFKNYPLFSCLTELFALEKEQSLFREKQIKQALKACQNRALLRNLSRSISISHGWEDLALFY